MNILYAGCFQDSIFFLKNTYFKEHLWKAASVKSSPGLPLCLFNISLSSLFQFQIITSSKFTEHFPWLNKVDYPMPETILLYC